MAPDRDGSALLPGGVLHGMATEVAQHQPSKGPMMLKLSRTLLLALATMVASGLAQAQTQTVSDTIRAMPGLSTFADLIRSSGLDSQLSSASSVTVFAPTNEAFDRVPYAQLIALQRPENAERLRAVLLNHVSPVQHTFIAGGDGRITLPTRQGGQLVLTRREDHSFRVNGAPVVVTNLRASNGMVHLIDTVQMP